MIANSRLIAFVLCAALAVIVPVADVAAQCATCGVPTVAYRPVAYTAYSPVVTTAYTGWYPGYWLGRANAAIWGAPRTYTANYYPTTYTAGYAPAYATTAYYAPSYSSYAPSYGGCSTCSASYAPACSSCSTCSTSYAPACSTCTTSYAPSCSTCGVQEVVMRPVCATACAPACDGCSSCSSCSSCGGYSNVSQAVYQETPACASCGQGSTAPAASVPSRTTYEPQPSIPQSENPPAERSQYRGKPEAEADPLDFPPEPKADDTDDSAANFQAPRLFAPNDRTAAAQNPTPVWTAVYHKQVANSQPPARTVSWQQAQRDAEGWSSASK